MKKNNYLNNKDILSEIHKSKNSFSSYSQPNYHQFDIIINSLEEINLTTIEEAKRANAKRQSIELYENAKAINSKVKQAEFEVSHTDISQDQLVFRVMTYDHIPDDHGRKKNPKTIALVLAGNIPMVGFHDLIAVWISGNNALVKCATKDKVLIPWVFIPTIFEAVAFPNIPDNILSAFFTFFNT